MDKYFIEISFPSSVTIFVSLEAEDPVEAIQDLMSRKIISFDNKQFFNIKTATKYHLIDSDYLKSYPNVKVLEL